MRGIRLVSVLLIIGILIFGCTGQSNTQVNANTSAQTGGTSPSSGSMPSGNAPSGTPNNSGGSAPSGNGGTMPPNTSGSGASAGANVSAGTSAGTSGSNDLTGKGYAALLALGLPVQCQVMITSNGTTETVNMYMDGKGDVRIETPNTQPSGTATTCTGNMVIVSSKTKMDMGCQSGQLFQGCDWFEFPLNESTTTGGNTGGSAGPSPQSQAPDMTNVPSTQFNCQPWTLDSSKFSTSGKICSMQDIMNNMGGGAGAGAGIGNGYG